MAGPWEDYHDTADSDAGQKSKGFLSYLSKQAEEVGKQYDPQAAKKDYEDWSSKPVGYRAIETIPAVTGAAGEVGGLAVAGPYGAMVGAGGGQAGGKYIENKLKDYFYNEKHSPEETADEMKSSALLGGGLSAAGRVASSALKGSGGLLSKESGKAAYKSTGPSGAATKYQTPTEVAAKGQNLREQGIVGGMPTSYEGLADRAEAQADIKGQAIDQMINKIADKSDIEIPKYAVINHIQEQMQPNPNIPVFKNTSDKIQEAISQIKSGSDSISLRDAQKTKSDLGQLLEKSGVWRAQKSGQQLTPENKFYVDYYHGLKNSIETASDMAANNSGEDINSQYLSLKKDYANAKEAYKNASLRSGKELANRHISLSDYISAAPAIAAGHPVGGVALGITNKAGRQYGNQVMAAPLQGAANVANTAGEVIGNPGLLQSGASAIQQNKESIKKEQPKTKPGPWSDY